jgi:hypothetical protein
MEIIRTQPAEIALQTLGEEDRRTVHYWLDELKNWERGGFVRQHSYQLKPNENVYVLQTSTDLRIFFRLEPDKITVLAIARKGAILTSGRLAEQGHS